MKLTPWISAATLAGMLAMGSAAQALQSDKQQPTTIDANQMTYNEKSNVNVFSGNVLLTRGSLVIRGDKLTLTERSDGTQFAKVEGKPARFKQQRDSETPGEVLLINGTGNSIEFDGDKSIVTLTGGASIQKSTNGQLTESISGNKITYEQNTEFLNVLGTPGKTGGSRVQAVIKPKTQASEPAN
ncbi:lipopolysaccharide transport periplasmic protein LptA [Limnobacter parvus]|uniref:Lipopolysaccharide export system protein LptA n=1 Tax=Limnobacter parvus TaxID=2939690 RepID=A0ABT1XDD3_9BURK|nr:lipopolysaccharide transport periplasmic protein LptA [Limnobacter parvus]MCR2745154.1 lipopolysaccharide transport periplasmic protein LptA [Limnobacter parvus]